MDFTLTEDQAALQETARKFAQSELPEVARLCEAENKPVPPEMLRRYAEMGFLGINSAPEHGGMGLGALDALIVLEEFAKISSAVAFPVFEASVGPVRIVERFGTPELAGRIVPASLRGEMLVAISMSEPDAGTALTDLRTTARIEGNEIVLNGSKRWCSGAGHSQGYVVFCRMSEDKGARGIGAVFVEKGTPGFTFGEAETLMGFRGVPSADMQFDDVRLPRLNLLAEAGGFANLMGAFNLERCGNATMSLGLAAGALEHAQAYTGERHAFGKPLVEFQAVQMKLAEMKLRVEAARLLIHRAVAGIGRGFPDVMDASLAKCFANEMVREVCGHGVQVMGGYGYHCAYGMEQRLRDAWGWGIAGGAIDIQKINIAAALAGRRFDQRR